MITRHPNIPCIRKHSFLTCLLITGLLLCAIPQATLAQQYQEGFGMESNLFAGRIVKHSAKFTLPIPDLTTAAEINLVWKTAGREAWQRRRHYPVLGLGITYTDYGNNQVYGQSIGIYPNLELPFIRGKKLEWTGRIGMGLGYISKHFSRSTPDWDTLNVAIGSHINNYTLVTSDVRYHVNRHLDLQLGVNFSHMSSAVYRKPNLGVNFVGAHIGVRYFPGSSAPQRIEAPTPALKNRWLLQARQGIAMTTTGSAGSAAYPVYLSSLYVSKRYHSHNKVFAGIDYSYHEGIYAFMRNFEIFPGHEKQHAWKSAAFVGHEFIYGRVGLLMQVGVYTHEAYLKFDPVYQKLGLNVYLRQKEKGLFKEVFVAALLKTHMTQAELAELGLGIGL